MADLKRLRNEQIEAQEEKGEENSKKRKHEHVLQVQLGAVQVQMLAPGKRTSSSDVMALLQPDQLQAVFEHLEADCQDGSLSKREYTKSGKFAKAGGAGSS